MKAVELAVSQIGCWRESPLQQRVLPLRMGALESALIRVYSWPKRSLGQDDTVFRMEDAMDFKRFAAATLTVVFALVITPRWAFASEGADVTAVVHRFLDNLDKNTLETALALCDSPTSIIDEFPPHEWHGPTACADWWKALEVYNEKSGITDGDATLGTPWTVDITSDRAYFVAPMSYTYKQHGKAVKESAAFAVALKRTQAGCRITAWAYSKNSEQNPA
jgi:hypothetical protein